MNVTRNEVPPENSDATEHGEQMSEERERQLLHLDSQLGRVSAEVAGLERQIGSFGRNNGYAVQQIARLRAALAPLLAKRDSLFIEMAVAIDHDLARALPHPDISDVRPEHVSPNRPHFNRELRRRLDETFERRQAPIDAEIHFLRDQLHDVPEMRGYAEDPGRALDRIGAQVREMEQDYHKRLQTLGLAA